MKNQDSRANTWARRILDDLRVNRQSGTYPYLYVSDLHHGWMNGLVAHAFGLAITGRPGQTYTFTSTANDLTHFNNMYSKFMTMAGNSKPNVLNADLVPFSIVENADSWAYAPNYMTNKECGSVEALVIFMDVALDKAKQNSDWTWFDSLLDFILLDNLTALAESSIESISLETDLTLQANRIRVIFGEFMQDKSFYKEEKNQTLIDAVGEIPKEIDLRYGQAVITESGETAQLLATRALAFYSKPWESVTVTAWLEALRIELADTVGLTSSFHNLTNQEFFLFSRLRDFNRKRIRLITARQKEWKT